MARGASSREVVPGRGQALAKRARRNSSGLLKGRLSSSRPDPLLSLAFLSCLKQILVVRVRLSPN
jgi:hypothetical protein